MMDADVEAEGVDTTRFVAQYKVAAWRLGFMYQTTDFLEADTGAKVFCRKKCFDAYKVDNPTVVLTWLAVYWHNRRLYFEDNRSL